MRMGFVILFTILLICPAIPMDFAMVMKEVIDDYQNEKYISSKENIIRNSTLNCMELEYTEITKIYQDFSDIGKWIEADSLNRLAVSDYKLNFNNELRTDDYIHLSRDFGLEYWDDFTCEFNFYLDSIDLSSTGLFRSFLVTFSTEINDAWWLYLSHEEMIGVCIDGNNDVSPDYKVWLYEYYDGVKHGIGHIQLSIDKLYYAVFKRIDDAVSLTIYNNSLRINDYLEGRIDLTLGGDWHYRYVLLSQSWDLGSGEYGTTGFLENLWVGGYTDTYEYEGYFSTKELISNMPGSTLALFTNTNLNNGNIDVQFSDDGSTWVNRNNLNGYDRLIDGFGSIDLRNLTFKKMFIRFKFTRGGMSHTPQLYQTRLILTDVGGEDIPNPVASQSLNEEIWMGLVFWVFMVLVGFSYKQEGFILSIASVIGIVESYLMLSANWTLIGLGMLITNLYLMYDGLMNW